VKCPFCAESVDDEATVCKTCRRDISIPKPLIEANRLLEQKVAALEAENAELTTLLQRRPSAPAESPANASLAPYVLLPIALIIAVHFLLVIMLDTKLIYLRVATALLPAVFGYALQVRHHPRQIVMYSFAIVVAVTTVLAMSTMVHIVGGDPILPQGRFDWIETAEYTASIALAFVLGSLIALTKRPLSTPRAQRADAAPRTGKLAAFLAHRLPAEEATLMEKQIERWEKVIRFSATTVTAAGVIYTGFKNFL
jgi:hypothetical protein